VRSPRSAPATVYALTSSGLFATFDATSHWTRIDSASTLVAWAGLPPGLHQISSKTGYWAGVAPEQEIVNN
jgi:hypothetical protein